MRKNQHDTAVRDNRHLKQVEEIVRLELRQIQNDQSNQIKRLFDEFKQQTGIQIQNFENKIINDMRSCLKKELESLIT